MEQILIKQIKIPKWSFKNINAETYKKLEASIIKNGQTQNIIVRRIKKKKYEIIDGKQVFKILKQLDRDFVWCHVYKKVNKVKAQVLYLEHDFYFEKNFVAVAEALKKICKKHSKAELSNTTNYTYKEIDELLKLAKFDFSKFKPIEDTVEQSTFFK